MREWREREMAAEIGEREMDYDSDEDMGVAVFRCDRDSPDSDTLKHQYYKSMADLAIDSYNQQASKEYRVVELILLDGVVCLLSELYMRFIAELDDDSDAAISKHLFSSEPQKPEKLLK